MTNLHIVPISLFIASSLLFIITIYMLISCVRTYCKDKESIGWFSFFWSCSILGLNLFFVIPHYEQKQSKINYCKSVKFGTKQYYMNCASKKMLCQSYDDGTLTKGLEYCNICMPKVINLNSSSGHVEIVNEAYKQCTSKFS